MSDLLDEAHEFLLCMDKMEYADALFALRAELTEARRQLAAQPAVPEAVAKDAARYRLLQRILFEDTNGRINAYDFPLADGSVFADRLSKTLDARPSGDGKRGAV